MLPLVQPYPSLSAASLASLLAFIFRMLHWVGRINACIKACYQECLCCIHSYPMSHSVLLGEDCLIEPKEPFWSNIYKNECGGHATRNRKSIRQRGNITDLVSYIFIGNEDSCLCCSKTNFPIAFVCEMQK